MRSPWFFKLVVAIRHSSSWHSSPWRCVSPRRANTSHAIRELCRFLCLVQCVPELMRRLHFSQFQDPANDERELESFPLIEKCVFECSVMMFRSFASSSFAFSMLAMLVWESPSIRFHLSLYLSVSLSLSLSDVGMRSPVGGHVKSAWPDNRRGPPPHKRETATAIQLRNKKKPNKSLEQRDFDKICDTRR